MNKMCKKCGFENQTEAKYCSECGSGLKEREKMGKEMYKNVQSAILKEWYSKETEKDVSDRFYHKSWFVILMLFFFFPLGLYLLWRHKKFTGKWRILLTIISVAFVMSYAFEESEYEIVTSKHEVKESVDNTEYYILEDGTIDWDNVIENDKSAADEYSKGEFEEMCISYLKSAIEDNWELSEYYMYKKVKRDDAYATPVCGSYDCETYEEIKQKIDSKLHSSMNIGKTYGAAKAHVYLYMDEDNRNMVTLLIEAVE